MKYEHLLLDMKNLLYRAFFAGYGDIKFKESKYDYSLIVLNFITSFVSKFRPGKIHAFWDCESSAVWRRDLLPSYKAHRVTLYSDLDVNISDELSKLSKISAEFLDAFGIVQYYRDRIEADDLIYAFTNIYTNDRLLLISSDGDFKQILDKYDNVDIYNPLSQTKSFASRLDYNIIIYKSLLGDKSDNIKGYYKVGKITAKSLSIDDTKLIKFLKSDKALIKEDNIIKLVGKRHFLNNLKLIDLSLCPYLDDNISYILNKKNEEVKFSVNKVKDVIAKYKLRGLNSELPKFFAPFLMR